MPFYPNWKRKPTQNRLSLGSNPKLGTTLPNKISKRQRILGILTYRKDYTEMRLRYAICDSHYARVTEWNRYPAQNRSFVGSTPTPGTFVVSRTTQWMDLTHPVSLLRENHAQAVHAHHGFMKVTHIPIISKSFPVGVVMESLSLRLMVQILPAIKQQRSRTVKARQQGAQRVIWGHSDNGQHFCLASRESGFDSP